MKIFKQLILFSEFACIESEKERRIVKGRLSSLSLTQNFICYNPFAANFAVN